MIDHCDKSSDVVPQYRMHCDKSSDSLYLSTACIAINNQKNMYRTLPHALWLTTKNMYRTSPVKSLANRFGLIYDVTSLTKIRMRIKAKKLLNICCLFIRGGWILVWVFLINKIYSIFSQVCLPTWFKVPFKTAIYWMKTGAGAQSSLFRAQSITDATSR